MGFMFYGGRSDAIFIEDRALAHLKVVVATKLRRNESFTLSWRHHDGSGRSTIWLHPAIPLRFVFDEPEPPTLSSEWITAMANSANTSGGISLIPDAVDPDQDDAAAR